MSEPKSDNWRGTIRARLMVGAAIFVLWAVGIQARLVYLQVHKHEALQARAENQSARTMDISAKRGDILDRYGRVLAYSVDADSVYGVPSEIENADDTASKLCAALTDCASRELEAIAGRLRQKRAFVYVRRRVTPPQATRIAELDLDGIGFIKEDRRFYPKKQLAAQLLGFVGVDNKGLAGIEAAYDSQISGALGRLLYQTDARGRAFSRLERPPTAGATVELTIDEYLQHVAERELRDAVAQNRAAGGTVVIMAPKTGEILALANEPTFNPNTFSTASPEHRRNRAVQDIYEPGSTFKVVTASAAIEERVIGVDDLIDVSGGKIRFGARVIHDTHDYGSLSFTDVMVKSSNVGAIKVGLTLGPERLGRYVRRFGFGRALSPDFPGETTGIVWDPQKLDTSALASMSMGYQIGVTPLQMVAAVSSVANGGDLLQPRVVRALIRDGKRTEVKPTVLGRTISRDTAATLTDDHGADRRARDGDVCPDRRVHHRRQNRNRRKARQWQVFQQRLLRVVCRVPAVAQPGRDHHRRHRLAARARLLRRPNRGPGVPADCPGHASASRRGPDAECAAARAGGASLRPAGNPAGARPARSRDRSRRHCRRHARSPRSSRTQRARSAACADVHRNDGTPYRRGCCGKSVAGAWNTD